MSSSPCPASVSPDPLRSWLCWESRYFFMSIFTVSLLLAQSIRARLTIQDAGLVWCGPCRGPECPESPWSGLLCRRGRLLLRS